MSSKLSATIIGRIGQDATSKKLDSGFTVINFSVAHGYTLKVNGEEKEQTVWIGVAHWLQKDKEDKLSQYLTKGTLVSVEGFPSAEGWKDNEGHVKSQLRLKSERIHILHRPKSEHLETQAQPSTPINDDSLPF